MHVTGCLWIFNRWRNRMELGQLSDSHWVEDIFCKCLIGASLSEPHIVSTTGGFHIFIIIVQQSITISGTREFTRVVFLVMSPHLQFCLPGEVSLLANAYEQSQKLDAILHEPCITTTALLLSQSGLSSNFRASKLAELKVVMKLCTCLLYNIITSSFWCNSISKMDSTITKWCCNGTNGSCNVATQSLRKWQQWKIVAEHRTYCSLQKSRQRKIQQC